MLDATLRSLGFSCRGWEVIRDSWGGQHLPTFTLWGRGWPWRTMLFLVFCGRKRLVQLFIFLELSGFSIEIPCFPERFYELRLFSEALDGYDNFLLLLGVFELSYKLLQVFFEGKDFNWLGEKKKKKKLHEGKPPFGECHEESWTFPPKSFLWTMNK